MFLLIAFAVTLIVVVFRAALGQRTAVQSLDDLRRLTKPVDLQAFHNLVDPAEERYLRQHLAPADFRPLQRQRMLAAAEYVSRTAHNAGIVLRLAQRAKQDAEPAVAMAADELSQRALRLRLSAYMVLCKIYAQVALPGAQLSLNDIAGSYQHLTDHLGHLVRMQRLNQVSRVAATL